MRRFNHETVALAYVFEESGAISMRVRTVYNIFRNQKRILFFKQKSVQGEQGFTHLAFAHSLSSPKSKKQMKCQRMFLEAQYVDFADEKS